MCIKEKNTSTPCAHTKVHTSTTPTPSPPNKSTNTHTTQSGWGDDEADTQPLNPHYNPTQYQCYSKTTRHSLAIVDETRIDYDLLEQLVVYLHTTQPAGGSFLVFLPGMGEIAAMQDRLTSNRALSGCVDWVLPLHSTVAPASQKRAFRQPSEAERAQGCRKIVLATNIAETSLTIEDVVVVVDVGKVKERRYDATRGMSLLVEDWVSQVCGFCVCVCVYGVGFWCGCVFYVCFFVGVGVRVFFMLIWTTQS